MRRMLLLFACLGLAAVSAMPWFGAEPTKASEAHAPLGQGSEKNPRPAATPERQVPLREGKTAATEKPGAHRPAPGSAVETSRPGVHPPGQRSGVTPFQAPTSKALGGNTAARNALPGSANKAVGNEPGRAPLGTLTPTHRPGAFSPIARPPTLPSGTALGHSPTTGVVNGSSIAHPKSTGTLNGTGITHKP